MRQPNYKEYLKRQEVVDWEQAPKGYSINFRTIAVFMVGVSMGAFILAALRACDVTPQPAISAKACRDCHYKHQLAGYFKSKGSRTPEAMADAILNTKSPRLLSSIAVVESGANPHIRNTGFKKKHSGAFQVSSKDWGAVPFDAAGQALQAERILEELTSSYPLRKALAKYGGDSTDKYSRKILAELSGVPR